MSVKKSDLNRTSSTGKTRGQKNITPISGSAGKTASGHLPITQVHPELEDAVRVRAYELYEERGRQEGFDQDDWIRAEEEILFRYQKEKSA